MADTDIFWDIRWYTVEQRRKRINSSALTRSSHWRAATKPRAICAARNWINSTDTSFSFSLSAKFSASYDRGNISTDRVCDHISYFIYIYISFSLLFSRFDSTRFISIFPIYRSRNRRADFMPRKRDGPLSVKYKILEKELRENYRVIEKYFPRIFAAWKERNIFFESLQIFSSTR